MYPATFSYTRPASLDEVHTTLAEHGGEAKLIAGGQSLLPMMKLRLAAPELLVDLAAVPELRGRWRTADGVRLAASTTYRELQRDRGVLALVPGLADVLDVLADQQVRARGTVGGAVAHADPTADLPPLLLALDATVRVTSSRGVRSQPLTDFIVGVFTTNLADDEVVTALDVPLPPPGSGGAYVKFEQPASHFALCGVAVVVTVEDGVVSQARAAMTGVTSTPSRLPAVEAALTGARADATAPADAAVEAVEDVTPLSDLHAPAAYRRHLLGVATRQAVEVALVRAGKGWTG